MSVQDELRSLEELHASGGMSDEDFEASKARLLATQQPPQPIPPQPVMTPQPIAYPNFIPPPVYGQQADQQTRQWAMMLHFALLAGCIIPYGGLIVPIIIWQMKKNEMPAIDAHGKVVVNWIISLTIYLVISGILCLLLIGIPMVFALLLLAVIFPIIGGIKANSGELWKYPLSIQFLK